MNKKKRVEVIRPDAILREVSFRAARRGQLVLEQMDDQHRWRPVRRDVLPSPLFRSTVYIVEEPWINLSKKEEE